MTSPMVRRSTLPDEWPEGFHPLMAMTRRGRPQPQRPAPTEEAAAWFGLGKDPRTVDVEANEDALLDYQRGVQAFTAEPTTLAPPPGTPIELRDRHELVGSNRPPVGYPLAPGQEPEKGVLVDPRRADLLAQGYVILPTDGTPALVVGADPYRRGLWLGANGGTVWIRSTSAAPAAVVSSAPADGGLRLAAGGAPFRLETTAAVWAWQPAAGSGAVAWLAEITTAAAP